MRYVGLDLHAKQSTLAILDPGERARATDALKRRERSLRWVLRTTESRCVPVQTCRQARARLGAGLSLAKRLGFC